MREGMTPAPLQVIRDVNEYIGRELRDRVKFDNREPFDSSGCYSLHALARRIYAQGWADGHDAEREESRQPEKVEET